MKRFSILTDDMEHCYICGATPVHIHEVFYGSANRKKSIEYGCCVPLCPRHHNMSKDGVHFDHELDWKLKQECQKRFEELHGFTKFTEVFRRNYLD